MAIDLKLLGKTLKDRRIELGLNQANVAEKAHCSQAYVSGLESATITNPTTNRLIKICEALEISYEELMSRTSSDYFSTSTDFKPSKEALELAKMFMGLSPQSKQVVFNVTSNAAKIEKMERNNNFHQKTSSK